MVAEEEGTVAGHKLSLKLTGAVCCNVGEWWCFAGEVNQLINEREETIVQVIGIVPCTGDSGVFLLFCFDKILDWAVVLYSNFNLCQ